MQYIIDLLPGLGLTLTVWAAVIAIGFPLGLAFGYAAVVGAPWVRVPVAAVVNLARGFPALVTLYFVYSGLPSIGVLLSGTAAIIVAFSFTTAGYTAGIFSSAIQSVPRSQLEATAVLGIGYWKAQRLVVLPQALRIVVPPLIGFSVLVLQATSLGYAVGLQETTGMAFNLGSISFHALQYMLAAGAFYLVICVFVSQLAVTLQRRSTRTRTRSAVPLTPTQGSPAVRTVA